jgi:hypothetical protein
MHDHRMKVSPERSHGVSSSQFVPEAIQYSLGAFIPSSPRDVGMRNHSEEVHVARSTDQRPATIASTDEQSPESERRVQPSSDCGNMLLRACDLSSRWLYLRDQLEEATGNVHLVQPSTLTAV